MADFIVILIIAAMVISALLYIRKSKKEGKHCIGCSSSGCCSGKCSEPPVLKVKHTDEQ